MFLLLCFDLICIYLYFNLFVLLVIYTVIISTEMITAPKGIRLWFLLPNKSYECLLPFCIAIETREYITWLFPRSRFLD